MHMPARLIVFILTLLVIVTFIGLNIENNSDIRIWFGEKGLLKDVPIFVSFFVMYLIGVLSAVPFVVRWRNRKKKQIARKTAEESESEMKSPQQKKKRVMGLKKDKEPNRKDSEGRIGSKADDEQSPGSE